MVSVEQHQARKNGTVAESDTLNTSSLLQAAQLMWEQDFAAPSPSMVGHRPASNQHPVGPYDHSVHAQHSQRSQHGISASMPATRAPSPVHEYPSFASTTVSPQGSRPLTPQEEGSFSFAGYTTVGYRSHHGLLLDVWDGSVLVVCSGS